jgi:hypothetical protein
MVVLICNPSTWEVEARESQVQGHTGLHSETLSHKIKYNIEQNCNVREVKKGELPSVTLRPILQGLILLIVHVFFL